MSQYHSNTPGFDPYMSNSSEIQQPPRTSVLAILSLVFALLCITSPLGLVFGGLAIVMIARSRGRLRGLGLAIGGTVIGLICSVILLGITIGVVQFFKSVNTETTRLMAAIEQDDVAAFRAAATPALSQATTDEEFAAFRAAYHAAHGKYVASPSSVLEFFRWSGRVGPQSSAPGDAFPMPMEFEKGLQPVFVVLDPQPQASASFFPPPSRLGIVLPGETTILWIDEAGDQNGAAPSGGGTPSGGAAEPSGEGEGNTPPPQ